ncbi:MAG: DUF2914 domain-containing protein [Methylococcaceae bacterium]|nr:DUF2914 domain-containing protein [Methylococcaceae bacterium]
MSEKDKVKKDVVFKVRFSKPKSLSKKKEQPQMITKWNYMRIAMAMVIFLILIIVGLTLLRNEDTQEATVNNTQQEPIKQAQTSINPVPDKVAAATVLKVNKQAVTPALPNKKQTLVKKQDQVQSSMLRAQLAKGIWQNEPFGNITGPIKVNANEATGIFYFTELENMKNKAIFHIWKYKGDVIFKKKKEVLDNRWNTYTSKLFTKLSVGPWSVETVDSNNRQLNLINFTVVATPD